MEDHRQGRAAGASHVMRQRRAPGRALDGDLCTATGCPARGGRPVRDAGAVTGEKISWMQPSEVQRAVAAAMAIASALGLAVDNAVVLQELEQARGAPAAL